MPLHARTNRADSNYSSLRTKHAPSHMYARGLNRAIVLGTLVWCTGIAATIVADATALSRPQPTTQLGAVAAAEGVAVVEKTLEWSQFLAELLRTPALLAAAALTAIAMGSLVVIGRSFGARAGAATISLGLYGALTFCRAETLGILESSAPSLVGIGVRFLFLIGCALLSWRWMEDVALGAALTPAEDPHAIDKATDAEAAQVSRDGPSTRDAASRRLDDAMVTERIAEKEPGLHGHGSPIPRMMPVDD